MFIGQTELLNTINNYTLKSLPHQLLLFGHRGCGKHTIAKYIANKFNLEYLTIDSKLSNEEIINLQLTPVNTLCVIEVANFSEKQQNQFLKLIEEPNKNIFIIILAEHENGILPTILNRCMKYYFKDYTKEELQAIANIDNDLVYKICNTPGQVLVAKDNIELVEDLYNLCTKLVLNITNATYSNTLTIASKINYKDEYNKFDFDMFFNMLAYTSFEIYIKDNNLNALKIYQYTIKYLQDLLNKRLIKETFVIRFITEIWEDLVLCQQL